MIFVELNLLNMKRNIVLLFVILISVIHVNAQVGIGTSNPVPSAALDITSDSLGFLPPRMDSLQRNAIVSPAVGLTIYNTSINSFEYYNGTKWFTIVHYVGELYGGGIVYYVYDGGQHGLIAAKADLSIGIRWYGGTATNTCARADGIGGGLKNTAIIIANQGPVDGNTFAARLCNEYIVTSGAVTYADWYLPSKMELNILFLQKNVVGGFANALYWSSTEVSDTNAWLQNFSAPGQGSHSKIETRYVRAIRAF